MYIVYEHISPNGKRYVGITQQTLDKRFGHKGIQYKFQNQHFWRAIQKYGWDNMEHNIIAEGLTHDEACARERLEIKKDKLLNNSYNITDGGDGRTGTKHSPETRAKISATLKGRKQSPETCQKCSKHAKDRKWIHRDGVLKFVKSYELTKYLNEGWVLGTGRPTIHDNETRQKISKNRGGKKMPKEAVDRIAAKLRNLPPYCWVHNDVKNTRIPISRLNEYLSAGWVRGRDLQLTEH